MKNPARVTLAVLSALGAAFASPAAHAQSSVTIYGRVDVSLAQQADAASNKELRNGSGSRLGFKGEEDLGAGLRAFFHLEHRLNADTGTTSTTRFWEGKSVVGLQGTFSRLALGRDENPAYTFSQGVADPWGLDTVASNGSIVSGRIGSTRYSNSVNWRASFGPFSAGAQFAEREDNTPASGGGSDDRPFSLGAAFASGALKVGLGHENPAGNDDRWTTVNASYDFAFVKLGGFVGRGKNAAAQTHRAFLVSAVAPVWRGELRASYGELENTSVSINGVLDKQAGLGYFHPLSRRTTLYANLVREDRDSLPSDRRKTGWDLGLKHNF
jgi:predicted porin